MKQKISVFPMCIKSVFESINSIRHNDIVREAMLLLISFCDPYASSSFTSNNVLSVDKFQTVKSQKVYSNNINSIGGTGSPC